MAWSQTHEDLFKRIDQELDAYAASMWRRPGNEVYDKADEIAAMRFCYNQLAGNLQDYQEQELEPLLQYEKPLEVVCRRWLCEQECDLSGEFDRVFRNAGYMEEQSGSDTLTM